LRGTLHYLAYRTDRTDVLIAPPPAGVRPCKRVAVSAASIDMAV